jgi:repressor of nif and glnA expression
MSKNEAILDLLETRGPMSVHRLTEAMNDAGYKVTSPGQTRYRLKTLERRGRVTAEEGERGKVWRLA